MGILIRHGGIWKDSAPYVRDGSLWKPVQQAWVKSAGMWKESYSSAPDIGEEFEGGYFIGIMRYSDGDYFIVLAPKEAEKWLIWKTSMTVTPGTSSLHDGWANCSVMNNTAHPAAKHCRDYRGGGFNDWYLGARDEIELMYRNLKPVDVANTVAARQGGGFIGENANSVPVGQRYTASDPAQTPLPAFRYQGGQDIRNNSHWSSTEVNQSTAWTFAATTGHQSASYTKNGQNYVRPIRKIKIR